MASACSALYFLNLKGDILIQRTYRDDVEYALQHSAALYLRTGFGPWLACLSAGETHLPCFLCFAEQAASQVLPLCFNNLPTSHLGSSTGGLAWLRICRSLMSLTVM